MCRRDSGGSGAPGLRWPSAPRFVLLLIIVYVNFNEKTTEMSPTRHRAVYYNVWQLDRTFSYVRLAMFASRKFGFRTPECV